MNTKTVLSITEARKKIFEIAKKVQRSDTHFVFTEKGRPKAVLMSAEEFESWQETLEVARDFPDLKEDIKDVKKELVKGHYSTLNDILASEGYIYVSNTSKRKGQRRREKNKRTI